MEVPKDIMFYAEAANFPVPESRLGSPFANHNLRVSRGGFSYSIIQATLQPPKANNANKGQSSVNDTYPNFQIYNIVVSPRNQSQTHKVE